MDTLWQSLNGNQRLRAVGLVGSFLMSASLWVDYLSTPAICSAYCDRHDNGLRYRSSHSQIENLTESTIDKRSANWPKSNWLHLRRTVDRINVEHENLGWIGYIN